MKIGDLTIERNKRQVGHIDVGELCGGIPIRIPLVTVSGALPGPTLWINAAVHGDELNGFEVLREIFGQTSPTQLCGTLLCTPISNNTALPFRSRNSIIDGLDLGRCFPGDSRGKVSERVASALFNEIKSNASHLVDLHTHEDYLTGLSYSQYTMSQEARPDVLRTARDMARAFSTEIVSRVGEGSKGAEKRSGFLDFACNVHAIPAVMAELGGGGRIDRDSVEIGKKGLLNVMRYLGMLEGKAESIGNQKLVTDRMQVRANESGIVLSEAKPGEFASQNRVMCRIVGEVLQEKEIIRAPVDCLVLSIRVDPIVHIGDHIATIATKWENVQ